MVTARTVKEGQAADGSPAPGSIETTAREVRERGQASLAIRLDLLDRPSIDAAIDETIERWGRIDVLLNNGIYTGPATLHHFLDLDEGEVRKMFEANVFAQIHITQRILPPMLERGSGSIINMVSNAGLNDPPAPAGKGGWGFAYGATKAAFNRMAGVLTAEHRDSGVRFFSVEPGLVMTEAMSLYDPTGEFAKRFQGAPMEVPAAAIAWLATDSNSGQWNGKTVFAQKLALDLGLVPDWRH